MISRWSQVLSLGFGVALAVAWACGTPGIGVSSGTGGGGGGGGLGGGGGAGGATTTTTTTTTSTVAVPSQVGDACAKDPDCGPGLVCILPTADDSIFGGGPAGGYCSASCALDVDCPGTDTLCLTTSAEVGTCVETCKIGPKLNQFDDALSPSKCRGRNDLRCTPTNIGGDVCLPTCSADGQCPTGMVCDPRTAVCVAPTSAGPPDAGPDGGGSDAGAPLPDGAKCDPSASPPDCAGLCVTFTGTTKTICSQVCVLGGDPAHPAASPSCGGVTAGLCIFRPANNGAGDYGYCAPACSKQDDCQNPDFWCAPVTGLTGTAGVTNGICSLGTACPNGASDCTSVAMSTCTDTLYGPICLTSDFPLGSAAPVDGGTDGGTDDGGMDGGTDDGGMDGGTDDGGTDAGIDDGGTDASVDDGGTDDGGTDDGGDAGDAG